MSEEKLFCVNCLSKFGTEEEAHDHWARACKYGGYNAPINDIIRPIKEFEKWQARKRQVRA